jgi:hypothetical protein
VSISPIFYEQLFRTKVFCATFMCLQFGFVIFWQKDFGAKAAHKMLVKLTPGACAIKNYGFVIYGKLTDFVERWCLFYCQSLSWLGQTH